jgi:hypothetical protein
VTVESAARIDGGDPVRLRGYVGDLWGHANDTPTTLRCRNAPPPWPPRSKPTSRRSALEVRAGMFEELAP